MVLSQQKVYSINYRLVPSMDRLQYLYGESYMYV